jgi:hypothetical protein
MDELQLLEGGALLEGTADNIKQEVELDLIREGFGNPRDGHYYTADVLNAAATMFEGAKMYADHLSPEAQRALGGMPRSVRDVMGRIRETWVDTDKEGRAVIRGRASISQPWLWSLVEHDPDLLGVSINARGHSKSGEKDGRQAKIVEAISRVASVDWVTEAGAGGKVRQLMEAQVEAENAEEHEDEETEEETASPEDNSTEPDGADEESSEEESSEDEAAEEEQTEADVMARQELARQRGEDPEDEEDVEDEDEGEEEEVEADADDIDWGAIEADDDSEEETDDDSEDEEEEDEAAHEALAQDPQLREWLAVQIEEAAEALATSKLREAVAAAVKVAREEFEQKLQEHDAEHERKLVQLDQRHLAAALIEEEGFKPPTEKALKEEFFDAYFEPEQDSEGNITKSSEEACREAVKAAIDERKKELSAYTEGRQFTEAGETTTSAAQTRGERGGRPKEATLDKAVDRMLGA